MTPADPLDRHVFGKLVALEREEPGFLAELIDEFEQGVMRRLTAIEEAIATADWTRLAAAAHSLRGSCGTVGAVRMAALAARMEDDPPATADDATRQLRELQSEYTALHRALDEARPAARPADPQT